MKDHEFENGRQKHITVTIKYAREWVADFNEEQRVQQVLNKALEYFGIPPQDRAKYELRMNDQILDNTAKLKDAGVRDHSILILTSREPGTEG